MKRGFILLEVIVASLIMALLATGLLTTIFQMSRLQETMNTITSTYGRVAIVQNQLERDLMGAFVPTQVDLIQTTTERRAQQVKPLEKIFYGTMKSGQLDLLTFITTNPLQIYFGIKDIKLKPRVARVVYRLIPDERRKNSYLLLRQEGTRHLSFDLYTRDAEGELRSYVMLDGIQRLEIRYGSIEQKTEGEEKKVTRRIYKKQKVWDSQKKQDEKQKQKIPPRLPHYIEVQIALWDSVYKDSRQFTFTIPIVAMSGEIAQQEEKKSDATAEKKKSDTRGRGNTSPAGSQQGDTGTKK